MTAVRRLRADSHVEGQRFGVNDIRWNTEQRAIEVGHTMIGLTPTEYRLLFALRQGLPTSYLSLARYVYNDCMIDEKVRLTMDRHIERIRGKLRGTGIYLYCILGYGYLLLPEVFPDVCQ